MRFRGEARESSSADFPISIFFLCYFANYQLINLLINSLISGVTSGARCGQRSAKNCYRTNIHNNHNK